MTFKEWMYSQKMSSPKTTYVLMEEAWDASRAHCTPELAGRIVREVYKHTGGVPNLNYTGAKAAVFALLTGEDVGWRR